MDIPIFMGILISTVAILVDHSSFVHEDFQDAHGIF